MSVELELPEVVAGLIVDSREVNSTDLLHEHLVTVVREQVVSAAQVSP